MLLNWEMMIGESNTRWHWDTADGSPEPAIPYDGWMFSDGTPVSYTEAAVMRNWTRGQDDFLHYNKFIPESAGPLFVEDMFLELSPGQTYTSGVLRQYDYVAETTVWGPGGGVLVRALDPTKGYWTGVSAAEDGMSMTLRLEVWEGEYAKSVVAQFNVSSLDCGWISDGWNIIRVIVEGRISPQISIFLNPMAPEAYAGGVRPRIVWTDPKNSFTMPGSVILFPYPSGTTRFDYLGVLPTTVL